ncbi:MAG: MFS transporter [Thermomicrobiales bacterium]
MNVQPGPASTTSSTITHEPVAAEPAPSAVAPAKRRGFAAFQSRNFVLLWTGLIISNVGTWMATTAEGWLVADISGDRAAFSLGLIGISFAIPMLVLPPFGGVVVDRVHRLKLLWLVQILYLFLSSALAILTLTGAINIPLLMGYAFLNASILAFDSPCRNALLPDIVTKEQLTSAVSMNSASFTGAQMIGPVIAGALIPFIGVSGVFVVNAVSCIATLWALFQMKGVPNIRHDQEGERVMTSIKRGVSYIRESELLSGLLLMSLIFGFFVRGFGPMLVVFARDIFHVGSVGFGLLSAATGFGTLAGALMLASRHDISNKVRIGVVAIFGCCAALFLFAISPWYIPAFAFLVVVGFFNLAAVSMIATTIQLRVPPELRGRVMSLYMLTVIGVPSAGAFLSGTIANLFGVQFAVAAGALIVLALVALTAFRNGEIREAF